MIRHELSYARGRKAFTEVCVVEFDGSNWTVVASKKIHTGRDLENMRAAMKEKYPEMTDTTNG